MLAPNFYNYDEINAFEFILQHSEPHKKLIIISRDGWNIYNEVVENKINELVEAGYIILVSASNTNRDCCCKEKTSLIS